MLAKFCQRGQVNVQMITREEIWTVLKKKNKKKSKKLLS